MKTTDAYNRWCPFSRRAMGENREVDGMPAAGTKCLAELCMSWRQDGPHDGHCELINFPPICAERMP